jgi:hypothetical protein
VRANQVGVEHRVQLLGARLLEAADDRVAGVVDERVDATGVGEHPGHGRAHRVGVPHVEGERGHIRPGDDARRGASGREHAPSPGGEVGGCRGADPGGGAGDQGDRQRIGSGAGSGHGSRIGMTSEV